MILTRDGKEITAIYKQNGTEIEEVKDANGRIVYLASREITGTLPLSFYALGKPLTDYRISGETLQDGTPTPEAPVDVGGCGVRTENLAYGSIKRVNISPKGRIGIESGYDLAIARVEAGKVYTCNTYVFAFYTDEPIIGSESYDGTRNVKIVGQPSTFTAPITGYVAFRLDPEEQAMLNLGSTLLPYEPYGYKLPLTVNGTEYPIYLGQVPTTRRIKKLVLTGEETWNRDAETGVFAMDISNSLFTGGFQSGISSHWPFEKNKGVFGLLTEGHGCIRSAYNQLWIRDNNFPSVADFKSYLAAQYAAGTPVTVWYVLAEPETGIVNEPLHRIGGYADTVSFTQAGVTIPTVSGANVLDMTSTVKPSEVYIKGKIKPDGYGKLVDKNGVYILDKDGVQLTVHGQGTSNP